MMRRVRFRRRGIHQRCVVLLATLAWSCGGSTPTAPTRAPASAVPAAPAPSPPRAAPPIVLTGQVTDAYTGAPIPGAVVSINGRYRAPTDSAGFFSVSGLLDYGYGTHDFTYVSADGYDIDYRFIQGTSQNVRLYPTARITAGETVSLTVRPTDTLCVNNVQDIPGLGDEYVCRSEHVVAAADGVLTLEAFAPDGSHPPVESEIVDPTNCCAESLGNPRSIEVSAGTEVVVNVEMPYGSTMSRLFTLTTSLAPSAAR